MSGKKIFADILNKLFTSIKEIWALIMKANLEKIFKLGVFLSSILLPIIFLIKSKKDKIDILKKHKRYNDKKGKNSSNKTNLEKGLENNFSDKRRQSNLDKDIYKEVIDILNAPDPKRKGKAERYTKKRDKNLTKLIKKNIKSKIRTKKWTKISENQIFNMNSDTRKKNYKRFEDHVNNLLQIKMKKENKLITAALLKEGKIEHYSAIVDILSDDEIKKILSNNPKELKRIIKMKKDYIRNDDGEIRTHDDLIEYFKATGIIKSNESNEEGTSKVYKGRDSIDGDNGLTAKELYERIQHLEDDIYGDHDKKRPRNSRYGSYSELFDDFEPEETSEIEYEDIDISEFYPDQKKVKNKFGKKFLNKKFVLNEDADYRSENYADLERQQILAYVEQMNREINQKHADDKFMKEYLFSNPNDDTEYVRLWGERMTQRQRKKL
jgi:hypothetical protein